MGNKNYEIDPALIFLLRQEIIERKEAYKKRKIEGYFDKEEFLIANEFNALKVYRMHNLVDPSKTNSKDDSMINDYPITEIAYRTQALNGLNHSLIPIKLIDLKYQYDELTLELEKSNGAGYLFKLCGGAIDSFLEELGVKDIEELQLLRGKRFLEGFFTRKNKLEWISTHEPFSAINKKKNDNFLEDIL